MSYMEPLFWNSGFWLVGVVACYVGFRKDKDERDVATIYWSMVVFCLSVIYWLAIIAANIAEGAAPA